MSYPPSDDLLPFHLFDTNPQLSPAPTYDPTLGTSSPGLLSHEFTSTSTSDGPDLNRPISFDRPNSNGMSRISSLPLTPAMRGILSATMSPSILASPTMSNVSFGNISSPAVTNKRQQQRRQSLVALSFAGLSNTSSRRPSDDDRRRSLDDNDVDDYVHEHSQYVADEEIQATWTESTPQQPVLDPTQVEAHNQLSSMYDDAMQQFQRSPQATQLKSLPSFANPNPTDASPPSSTSMSLTPLQVNSALVMAQSLRPLVHQLQHQQWKQQITRSQREIETSTIRRSTRLQQKQILQPEASPMGSIRSVEQTDDETSVGEKETVQGETPPTTPTPDDIQTQNESDQLSSTLSSQLRIPQHATPAQPKRTAVTKMMAQNLPTIPGFASPPIHPPPNKRNRGSSLISPPVKGEAFVVPSRQMVTSMQNELIALRQALKEEQTKVAALEHAARNPSIYDAVSWTLYRSMFVRSPMLMYCLDMHRRCVDANDVFLSRHGWLREEIQGKHIPPANGPTPASILAGHLINQQLVAPTEIAPLKAGLPSSLSPTDLLPNPVTITSLHALLTQQQSHVTVTERMVNGHGELVEIDWHYWVLIDTSNVPIYLIGEASQHHIRTLISHHHHTTPHTTTSEHTPTQLTSPHGQTTPHNYKYDQHTQHHSHSHSHQDPHSLSSHADSHQHPQHQPHQQQHPSQHPPQHQSHHPHQQHSHDPHITSSHSHSHSHTDIPHPQFHPDTSDHSHYLQS